MQAGLIEINYLVRQYNCGMLHYRFGFKTEGRNGVELRKPSSWRWAVYCRGTRRIRLWPWVLSRWPNLLGAPRLRTVPYSWHPSLPRHHTISPASNPCQSASLTRWNSKRLCSIIQTRGQHLTNGTIIGLSSHHQSLQAMELMESQHIQ